MWQIYQQLVAVQREIYLTGSTSSVPRGLAVPLLLSGVHVGMSVLIALLSLPLVSIALGSVGRAPLLEALSRGRLGTLIAISRISFFSSQSTAISLLEHQDDAW